MPAGGRSPRRCSSSSSGSHEPRVKAATNTIVQYSRDPTPRIVCLPGGGEMNRTFMWMIGTATICLAVSGAWAMSAQDKYTVKVPGGLAFSEFKGYESWQTISVSHNGPHLALILGNPAMIDANKGGIPANGKPFPDGAKRAKVPWNPKKNDA